MDNCLVRGGIGSQILTLIQCPYTSLYLHSRNCLPNFRALQIGWTIKHIEEWSDEWYRGKLLILITSTVFFCIALILTVIYARIERNPQVTKHANFHNIRKTGSFQPTASTHSLYVAVTTVVVISLVSFNNEAKSWRKKLNLNFSLLTLCGLELVWLLGGLVFSIGNHSIVSTLINRDELRFQKNKIARTRRGFYSKCSSSFKGQLKKWVTGTWNFWVINYQDWLPSNLSRQYCYKI